MKKLSIFVLLFVTCFCGAFVGCGQKQPEPIVLSRYFGDTVESQNAESGYNYFHLTQFAQDQVDTSTMKRHSLLTFSGDRDWITGMYVKSIYFYVVADTKLVDEQLSFVMYGLGNWDEASNKHKYEEPNIGITTEANQSQLVRLNINCRVTEDVSIQLKFVQNSVNFKWTIFGLKVYGEFVN